MNPISWNANRCALFNKQVGVWNRVVMFSGALELNERWILSKCF